jgi:diguanylate cyclase (GGDEF)-like protein
MPWRSALNSLQFKASVLIILLVLVVTVIGLHMSLRLMSDALYSHSMRHTLDWAQTLASGTSSLVGRHETEPLVRMVNDSLWTRGVAFVVVADQQKRILASGEEKPNLLRAVTDETGGFLNVDEVGRPSLVRKPVGDLSYVDVTVPIFAESHMPASAGESRKVIGFLRLATNVSLAEAQLRDIEAQLRRVMVGLLLLAATCSLVAMRKVVSPLNELARTARELASGVMDARAHVSMANEIGDLARAFNDMAERLAGAQFEMLKLNAELEERVQQRTHQLEDLASRDPLTGLYNRRYFGEVFAREFSAAERYDADLTCLMFDLDHFKETNDRFGHRMGDEVLVTVGKCIRGELRDADVAARFGGDEFILLLPRTSAAAAGSVADRIVTSFAETLKRQAPEVPTTLSIGVASLRITRARSAEALIHEADLALYAAKTAGRNRTVAARGASSAVG